MENGYEHAGYSFYNEAQIEKQQIEPSTVPCGLLLHVTQKALQQIDIETHLDQNGYLHECNQPLTLLGSHSCMSTQSYNAIVQQNKVKIQQININDKSIYNTIDPESLPQPILIQPQEAIKLTKQKQNNIEELKTKIEESRKQENQMIEFIQSLEKQQQDQLSQETQDFCINQVKNVLKTLKKQKIDLDDKYLQNVELNEQQSIQQSTEATNIQDVISSPQKSKLVVIYKQFDSQPIQIIEMDNKQLDQNNTSDKHFTLVLTKNKLKCIAYDDHQLQISKDIITSSQSQEFVDMFWDSKLKQLIIVQNDSNITILELQLKQDHLAIKLKGRKYYCGMLQVQKLFYNKDYDLLIIIGERDMQIFSIEELKVLKVFLSGQDAQKLKQSYIGQPNYEIMQTLSDIIDDQIELSENQQDIIFSVMHNNQLYIQLKNNVLLQFNILGKYYQPKNIVQLDQKIQMYLFYNDKNYLLLDNHKIYMLEELKTTLIESEFQPIYIATINNSMLIFTEDQKLLTYDKYTQQDKQLKQDFDLKQVCNINDQILNVILSKDELLFLVEHINENNTQENKLICVNLNNENECKIDQRFGNYQVEKLLSDKYVILKNRCICIRLQAGLRD